MHQPIAAVGDGGRLQIAADVSLRVSAGFCDDSSNHVNGGRRFPGMDTTPLWLTDPGESYPPLKRNLDVDVLVVGAGITGVTTAYLLAKSGRKVALVERASIGGGETGHTTAHITCVTDLRLSKLVEVFGHNHAQAAWDAGQFAMEQIFDLAGEEQIECGLRHVPGYLFSAFDHRADDEANELHREAHLASEFGLDADFLDHVPIMGRPGIRFANQAEFHPVRYVRALAAAAVRLGCQVFEKSSVEEFGESPRRAKVNGHTVSFERCVIATHVPLQGRSATFSALLRQTKLVSYSTYAIGGSVPKGEYPRALFWDTADPYSYIRIHAGDRNDYVIVGGDDHKTGQADPEEAYARLAQQARLFVPHVTFDHRWSGQVVETHDGLPLIGETCEGEFIATGFSGNGITFGTLGGIMARDWVEGLANPWTDLFDVRRKKLSATWDYLRENKDYPFYLAKGLLAAAEASNPEAVPTGEGRIVRVDGHKVAVHRDEKGELHVCSAVCPHLGCIVEWNGAEKTWDCPCHGSRFMAGGELVAGPAEGPLEPREAAVAS
jgi:glycine/D-amino acid oxidase-like deaminating enzyme/nitrite reductase/ring-hydroxylating ferredoxin subunit